MYYVYDTSLRLYVVLCSGPVARTENSSAAQISTTNSNITVGGQPEVMQDSCTMLLGMDEHGNATQTASRGRSGVNLMRCVIQIPWSARNKSNSKFCLEYILVFDVSKKYNCCGQIWISLRYIDDFFSSLRAITIWFYLILVGHDFFQEVPQAAIPTMHSGSKRKSDTCHSIEAQHEANAKVGNNSKYYESLRNVLPNDGSSHWIIRFTVFHSCLVLDKVTHETSEGTTVRCHL